MHWKASIKEFGGMKAEMTARSDKSFYYNMYSNALSSMGLEAMDGFKVRLGMLDDGSSTGGMFTGYCFHHGDFHQNLMITLGNRATRFEEFSEYKWSPDTTFASAF